MVNIILEQVQPSDEQLCNGDSNNDGIINVVDVVHIVNYILDN